MTFKLAAMTVAISLALPSLAHASPSLIALGTLSGSTDLSSFSGMLENGVDQQNVLGGMGSGLAWAGGNTFLALPDRGPNAATYNPLVDNTTSYISRFQTLKLDLTQTFNAGSYSYSLTPTLTGTTLLYSNTALNYGTGAAGTGAVGGNNYTLGSGATINAGKYYFNGRSDNFLAGSNSSNPDNGRFDPEAIRVSNDGKSVYISDEYGPYVYQFDRATGARTNVYSLPAAFTANNLSSQGANEISGNSSGRVANKGMEGLAITPDGTTLVGFEQSPLIQDGGDGGRANRLVTIDTQTGATKQYVFDNYLSEKSKSYNSSEILAVNDHTFLVLERDGKGLGDDSKADVKRIYKIDLNDANGDGVSGDQAVDIGALNGGAGISGQANLLGYAVQKTLFLDLKSALTAAGIANTNIPSKLEGITFGQDITEGGVLYHTLYVANDNDFLPGTSGTNNFFVFKFTDADLNGSVFTNQAITASAVPEPENAALLLTGLACIAGVARRRKQHA
ncbi:esterase-like activity of phytase family protein [Methylophilus aquaticus]|uniref:Esterase-like activity of phytase family protein n=1 Tax=Methylophilus aquaticus TaxID=1971610 RepID=A0ABT9JTQ3_9PROT|nr:esterase-like activity of phytase family protein [Methylophilus aquaticus]MDP8567854.1 esterase-like activity of phytase family protein [Methylophilus aquaticus]